MLAGVINATGIAATGLAAMLGSAQARAAGMSPLGSLVVAGICGMGGGTVRDMLLGKRAFWVDVPCWLWYTTACGLAGMHTGVVARVLGSSGKVVDTVFTAALGGCALAGANVAQSAARCDPLAAAFFAMLSATGGSVVRDILMQRQPSAFYADGLSGTVPAVVGAAAALATHSIGIRSHNARMAVAVLTAIGVNRLMVSQHPTFAAARSYIATVWGKHKVTAAATVSVIKEQPQKK